MTSPGLVVGCDKPETLYGGRRMLCVPPHLRGPRVKVPSDDLLGQPQQVGGTAIRLMQYNVLAQGLINRRTLFKYLSKSHARFKFRKRNLLEEIKVSKPDVCCFQELDHYYTYWKDALSQIGLNVGDTYVIGMKRRDREEIISGGDVPAAEAGELLRGSKLDAAWGTLVAFRKDKFVLEKDKCRVVDFEDMLRRDPDPDPDPADSDAEEDLCPLERIELGVSRHFAQFVVLRVREEKKDTEDHEEGEGEGESEGVEAQGSSPPMPPMRFLIVNTHLMWRPAFGWVRVRHLMKIRRTVESYLKLDPSLHVIFMGDLNTSPNDPPYILNVRPECVSLQSKSADAPDDPLVSHLERSQMEFPEVLREWRAAELKAVCPSGNVDADLPALVEERKLKIREVLSRSLLGPDRHKHIWFSAYGLYQRVATPESAPGRKDYWEEPNWTVCIPTYRSVLDYIMLNYEDVVRGDVQVLALLEIKQSEGPFPNATFSSDHTCLVADVQFRQKEEK